jgi:hypothetical protein
VKGSLVSAALAAFEHGREPAALEACPLKSSNAAGGFSLPAVPFRASIVGGKCKCFAPQVCDE